MRFCKFKVNTYTKYYYELLQLTKYTQERLIELFVIPFRCIKGNSNSLRITKLKFSADSDMLRKLEILFTSRTVTLRKSVSG